MSFSFFAFRSAIGCLNPYYTGSYSMRWKDEKEIKQSSVLILIILEVTL